MSLNPTGLVAYDYSSSENESDHEPSDSEFTIKAKAADEDSANNSGYMTPNDFSNNADKNKSQTIGLDISAKIAHLPESKNFFGAVTLEENDKLEEFIPTIKTMKDKNTVKIMIPSLSEFKDVGEDEPLKKRVKPSEKGSSLLKMLPPIKTAPVTLTSFVPNSLSKKATSQNTSTSLIPESVKKNKSKKDLQQKIIPSSLKEIQEADSDEGECDLTDQTDIFDAEMWEKICGRSKTQQKIDQTTKSPDIPEPFITIAPQPDKPLDALDNKAFKKLVGKSKSPMGNIKLIDINEEQILPDKELWMTKSLTDPEMAPRVQVAETVDPTKRRKHHITYLAQQAKANEQELKSDIIEISKYCTDQLEQNFANIIGCIEDTLISENFVKIQTTFMETYWKEFSDDEENKLIYTEIFHKYLITVEDYIENELVKCVPTFCMKDFEKELQARTNELDGEIYEILCTFWDFQKFKSMFLEYKKVKEGRCVDFSTDIVVVKYKIDHE